MNVVNIRIGDDLFAGRLQSDLAPATCARFRALLPLSEKLIHVRWSGEGCWIPLGDLNLPLPLESPISSPRPGEFILYPGGISETEILLAYGDVRFACKKGELVGNPFLIITEGVDHLAEIGRAILWQGAREIRFA